MKQSWTASGNNCFTLNPLCMKKKIEKKLTLGKIKIVKLTGSPIKEFPTGNPTMINTCGVCPETILGTR